MALKLRRRMATFTIGSLSQLNSRLQQHSLGMGAGSFKRVLGSATENRCVRYGTVTTRRNSEPSGW